MHCAPRTTRYWATHTTHLLGGHDVHLITCHGSPDRFSNTIINAIGGQPASQVLLNPLITHFPKQLNHLHKLHGRAVVTKSSVHPPSLKHRYQAVEPSCLAET